MESGADDGGNGGLHTVHFDQANQRIRLDDGGWLDISPSQTKLIAKLLEEPVRLRTKEELTQAVNGHVIMRDKTVDNHFFHLKERIDKAYPELAGTDTLMFWKNKPRAGYILRPGWKSMPVFDDFITDILTEHLNRSLAEIYWRIRQRPDINIRSTYEKLQKLAKVCQMLIIPDNLDEARWNWVNFIVRTAIYLNDHGVLLDKREFVELARQFEEIYHRWRGDLWVAEWRALYLEMIEDFAGAGQASEQVIAHGLKHSYPVGLLAALYSRAAQCYEQAHEGRKAAEFFMKAAEIFGRDGRVSHKALEYYHKATRLYPELLTAQVAGQITRLRCALEAISATHRGVVAIVSNNFDDDVADFLVDPLFKAGIQSCFKASSDVEDLADLSMYDAIVVVGSIKARDTDYHVYKYFYTISSQETGMTCQNIDIHALHHCETWYTNILGKPTYVLAGLSREDTCKAVMHFADGELLAQLGTNSTKFA
ncbi:MAG TPA: hypothetical protein PKK78_21310 [Kouleothrix sp.]|uniref:hypothetical protein n=1 Tax=Kouleothrix sp. TaxID=2779161 RepID=UPI002B7EC981|nr:hypothetical protein [Kouleothrix sp.]